MAVLTRNSWIKLYKDLQRAAKQLPQYNYQHFTKDRVRDYFEKNRSETTEEVLEDLYKEGKRNLAIIQRQITISKIYPNRKLIIEPEDY